MWSKKFLSSLTFTWNLNASLLELVSVSASTYLWLREFLTSYTHRISEFWRIVGAPQYQQPLLASLTHYGQWNILLSCLSPSLLPSFTTSFLLPSFSPPSLSALFPSFLHPSSFPFFLPPPSPPLPFLPPFLVKIFSTQRSTIPVYELTELTKSKISKLTQIFIGYTVSVLALARTC